MRYYPSEPEGFEGTGRGGFADALSWAPGAVATLTCDNPHLGGPLGRCRAHRPFTRMMAGTDGGF